MVDINTENERNKRELKTTLAIEKLRQIQQMARTVVQECEDTIRSLSR